jgi:hypothetical protein
MEGKYLNVTKNKIIIEFDEITIKKENFAKEEEKM